MVKRKFPFVKQLDSQDCGFACLKMIGKSYNENYNILDDVIWNSNLSRQGISISDLGNTSKELGFDALLLRVNWNQVISYVPLPAIFFWNQNHFIVVYKIYKNKIYVSDPAIGKISYTKDDFLKGWTQNEATGLALLLEPNHTFSNHINTKKQEKSFRNISKYLVNYKGQLGLISLTLLLSSCIELIFPFFFQKIIDNGIVFQRVNFIYLVLFAQLLVVISRISLEFYRSWLFIHISSRVSLSMISDFWVKLLKLPLRFFNSKNIGDITQRIQDHNRIEEFLSKDLIQTIFSIFSIIIYSCILLYFNLDIFLIVFIGTAIELFWIFSFLEKIKLSDYKNFTLQSKDQSKIIEFITNVQEIKLNNLEEQKTKQWQEIQKKIYKNNIDKLKINQKYESYRFFTYLQVILVIFVAATSVMNNQLTIGTMMSIMFIINGINMPISQLINFVLRSKLTSVSLERLNEIHSKKEEENPKISNEINWIQDIIFDQVSFAYIHKDMVLNNINLIIPKNKTTAIVGVSGSGKTTLLKLILKFYKYQEGNIFIGKDTLERINNQQWRKKCGVIFQDSTIFSDTIKYNISLEENPNIEKLTKSMELANIRSFVEKLPLKENTFLGPEGIGISEGQKQRLLIARVIYKDPDYLFFDEATNALDADNEKVIVDNINYLFKNKTVIIVAHRLSTVRNADQIVVLNDGSVIEQGSHDELIKLKGKYYNLIKNQLELGK